MSFQLRPYFPPDLSALSGAPEVKLCPAPADGVAPEGYHAMSIFPEYFKIGGTWHLASESRMDCVAVWEDGRVAVREFRRLRRGDLVAVGRTEQGEKGILVHPDGFREQRREGDLFAFRQGRSRETAFSRDYDELYELLRHERDHGKVVWVMGPAFAFDHDARDAFARLVEGGYVHAVLAGNALATHDLEAAYRSTALGQNIYTQESQPLGHYNHLDTINAVRRWGSIPAFLKGEHIDNGIIWACEKMGVPYVLHPGRRPPAPGDRQRLRGPGCHARPGPGRYHRHLHGHHPPHHRHRQHDPLLPGAAGRHRAPGVFLLCGHLGVHRQQALGPGQPLRPGHRHQRPGLHCEPQQGPGTDVKNNTRKTAFRRSFLCVCLGGRKRIGFGRTLCLMIKIPANLCRIMIAV